MRNTLLKIELNSPLAGLTNFFGTTFTPTVIELAGQTGFAG